MKIYAVTEHEKPFVSLSTGLAYKALGEMLGCEAVISDYPIWGERKIERDSGRDVIVLFEAAYVDYIRMSVKELRSFFPNAKLVCLGSDTVYYVEQKVSGNTPGCRPGWQINNPLEVDLFLETMQVVLDDYAAQGVKVDNWMWTCSGENLRQVKEYQAEKNNDFVCVLYIDTLMREGSYRNKMMRHVLDNGWTFSQGNGSGHMDVDVDKIYKTYARSRFTLGTSSHGNPLVRGMKGWRDWIGPHMGALLIYDDHPDVVKRYYHNGLVPLYPYGDFDGLLKLAGELKEDKERYHNLLTRQKAWAEDNTIEKQLFRLLHKHDLLPK